MKLHKTHITKGWFHISEVQLFPSYMYIVWWWLVAAYFHDPQYSLKCGDVVLSIITCYLHQI